jgi:hypothetical protein
MSAWSDLVITYACSECGAKGGTRCITVHANKGRNGRHGKHTLGVPTLPHRARRHLALRDHFPHLADVTTVRK